MPLSQNRLLFCRRLLERKGDRQRLDHRSRDLRFRLDSLTETRAGTDASGVGRTQCPFLASHPTADAQRLPLLDSPTETRRTRQDRPGVEYLFRSDWRRLGPYSAVLQRFPGAEPARTGCWIVAMQSILDIE